MKKGRYQKIKSTLWNHQDFLALVPEDTPLDPRLLYFYLMNPPMSNILGLYVIKEGYASEDLKCPPKDFTKCMKALIDNGFVSYDFKNKLVFIINHLKHNPITNDNQVKSCVSAVRDLPKTHLLKALLSSIHSLVDIGRHYELYAALRKVIKQYKLIEGELPPEPPPPSKKEPLIEGEKLAKYFIEQVLKNQPDHRIGNRSPAQEIASITRWSGDFDKLMRLDNQTIKDIREVIRWCTADDFWKSNIEGGAKFRKQWDKLKGRMNEEKRKDGYGPGRYKR